MEQKPNITKKSMKYITLPLDDETHRAAKGASGLEGIGFYVWCQRTIRRAVGLSDYPEPHEMTMEDQLSASVKEAKK